MAESRYTFQRTRIAWLVCEDRKTVANGDRAVFVTVDNPKRCGEWTHHSFLKLDGSGRSIYACGVCQNERVWGFENT